MDLWLAWLTGFPATLAHSLSKHKSDWPLEYQKSYTADTIWVLLLLHAYRLSPCWRVTIAHIGFLCFILHSLLVSSGKHLSTMAMYFSSVVRTVPPVGSSLWRGGTPFMKLWRGRRVEKQDKEIRTRWRQWQMPFLPTDITEINNSNPTVKSARAWMLCFYRDKYNIGGAREISVQFGEPSFPF